MSIFGNILGKIFHHGSAESAPTPSPASAPAVASQAAAQSAGSASAPATAAPQAAVNVGQVLGAMVDEGRLWRQLPKLDRRSAQAPESRFQISTRRELAQELGVHAGDDGTAEQNIALHRAVMHKLAENGGLVPISLRQ